ncbi:hypothetical protein Bca52824_080070 [Brassica carinata]|uniref:Uncharacterized protein n=1 Tax=Brassica carinata TaxID=52824 RepID=A0A8X7U1C7_BRACI|nr:hypothetical protein Bca52824_080070 [Brassica carinata]
MATTLHCLSTLHLLPRTTHRPKTLNSLKPQPRKIPELPSIPNALHLLKSSSLPLALTALPFLIDPQDAAAAGGQFGILEGRSFALIHPIVMGGLFVYTLYAGYLADPVSPDGSTVVESSSPPSATELEIRRLTEERKELVKGSYRDKHFDAGSVLLGFGVLESVFGGLNTYLRTGKLFPGPHLYAGAGITVLWAAAAALVPAMQKGNETARNLHIALNGLNVLLFIWQIPTGFDIVLKVFEFTKWP